MPTMLIGSADVNVNESVGQEPPRADDGTKLPSAIADPALNTLPSGDDVRSQPKRKVWDQGMSESGGGCVAEHCKEPNWVDEMVSCIGVSCSDQVSVIIWIL